MADAPTAVLLTADDLLALPDDGNRYELVAGRLVCMPPASYRSGVVALNLGAVMTAFVRQHRLGVCSGADGGVQLREQPDTVRAPDISFIRGERLPPDGILDGEAILPGFRVALSEVWA